MNEVLGPCTNTLPFRVGLHSALLGPWLQSLHQAQVRMIPFEHTVLTESVHQSPAGRAGPLFHTLLGFENFPEVPPDPAHKLVFSEVRIHEFTEYPLSIGFIEKLIGTEIGTFYSQEAYSESTIVHLVGMVQAVITQILSAGLQTNIDTLALVTTPPGSLVDHGEPLSQFSLAQQWDEVVQEHSNGPALIFRECTLLYHEVNMLADSLACQTTGMTSPDSSSIVALVDGPDSLMISLLAGIKLGAQLLLMPMDKSIDQLVACVKVTDSRTLWLPSDQAEAVSSHLPNGIHTGLFFLPLTILSREQLVTLCLPKIDKRLGDYALTVRDSRNHPCPPDVIGRLDFSNSHNNPTPIPFSRPILAYRDVDGSIRILGSADQRVTVRGQHVHLGTVEQALIQAGARSTKALLLPNDRLVVLVANSSDDDLALLRTAMLPPTVPTTLIPHTYISIHQFPHLVDKIDQPHQLTAASLAQLEQLQYCIGQKYHVTLTLGELVKFPDVHALAHVIVNQRQSGVTIKSLLNAPEAVELPVLH
ncbi:hypothetical protein H4R33_007069, partial [Dimargaris cristalligena]